MIGKTLGHYEILAEIGRGGMGVVYRARDTRLGRDVALKILPAAVADDVELMARFEREGRVLASLNHPGIASIYGIEEESGRRFLAMELAEGEDLAQRLSRGPLSVEEAIGMARQIAEAMEAAHTRGVVHRDLKPANIKVSPQGKVKILDFGLAKALDDDRHDADTLEDSPTISPDITRTGVILGTAAYMSPEQTRGEVTDTRTDIWAFGCVLWECLTARKVFGGKTASDSIGAILRADPDWDLLPPQVPIGVRRLLRRCLSKHPNRRLHHIADARIELEDLEVNGEVSPAAPSHADPMWSLRRYRVAVLILSGLLVLAAGALVLRRSGVFDTSSAPMNPLANAKLTKLTDFPGDELSPAVSPDGRFVAFASDRDGGFDVLVGQIGSRDFRNVTRGQHAPIHTTVRSIGFTWDGSQVWIGGSMGRVRTAPLLGGPLRNFLGEEVIVVDWSPDTRRLVYRHPTGGDPVFVADRDGANSKLILASPDGYHQHFPTWSADEEWIYVVRGWPRSGEADLWRLRPDGSDLEQLTEGLKSVSHPTPIDPETVLFCAQDRDGAGPWLWMFDVPTRTSHRISFGVEQYTSLAANADGSRLVATVANQQAVLWRVPIGTEIATERNVEPFPLPTVRATTPRFGPAGLFYVSSRGTDDGLWLHSDGEAMEIWRGTGAAILEAPAVSPGGDLVALELTERNRTRILILSADGAERRELPTGTIEARGGISWSPDGRWIATGGAEGGRSGLFKIPVDGGTATRIVDGLALRPVWSPRGDLIVYAGAQIGPLSRLMVVRADGTPVDLPEIKILFQQGGTRARFLPDGRGLVYMQGETRLQDFYLLDLTSMQSRRLTRLQDPSEMSTFDVTPDGSAVVFDRLRRNSDLVLIELKGTTRHD